jgi:hypothetical protein
VLAVDPKWAVCGECNCVDGFSPIPRWEIRGVIEADRQCPRQRLTGADFNWVELYGHYKAGHLLRAGGIEDQPAIYLEAMQTVAYAIGLVSNE